MPKTKHERLDRFEVDIGPDRQEKLPVKLHVLTEELNGVRKLKDVSISFGPPGTEDLDLGELGLRWLQEAVSAASEMVRSIGVNPFLDVNQGGS